LWVGQRDFFRRLASTTATARTAVIAAATLLITAGGIEDREVLANRTRCLLGLRPGNRLIAGRPLLLVHVCLDQARIDRKPFAANQPNRDALRHHALKHPAQGVALAKALVPCAAEHRMVGDTVLDAELTEPAIGKVHLYLGADSPLRADRKHVANNQHPDHEYRIDRRSPCVRVVRCKLLVHPTQVEHRVDLPDQMIRGHYLVEIKRIKELALSTLSPPHHGPLPRITAQSDGITVRPSSQREFCNTFPPESGQGWVIYEYTPQPEPERKRFFDPALRTFPPR